MNDHKYVPLEAWCTYELADIYPKKINFNRKISVKKFATLAKSNDVPQIALKKLKFNKTLNNIEKFYEKDKSMPNIYFIFYNF